MGKRKGRKETQETLILGDEIGRGGGEGAGFFGCYLLTSLCPRFKGHTYIGYTLNPRRRIRQHNGEIVSGAWQTKRKRPWEMVLCIYGFPTNTAALQFEWAWQHPLESLAVRAAASSFKSLGGLATKIKLAYTMLTLPAWQSLNLTVNLFSTKYQSYTSGCPTLPEQMQTRVCSMDGLPCYNDCAGVIDEWDDNECEGSLLESTEQVPTARKPNDDSLEENVPLQIVESPLFSKEDQRPSFVVDDFPATKSFSSSSSCIVEDKQSPRVVELITEFSEPLKKQSRTALVAIKDQVLIKSPDQFNHGVEIIDVLTPPCHPVNSGSKKRRRSLGPVIIDLTNSPLFV
ncbi:hypothetical protein OROHE_017462 [Orobanche hederae]